MDHGSIDAVRVQLTTLRAIHSTTHAVRWFDDDRALADAAHAEARSSGGEGPVPLLGRPITVKDWIDVEGFRCAGETAVHADRRPEADATVVARLRAAGAVVMAKTVAWGGGEGTERVRHPLDPARTAGGSSTGEAVVVAAGGSPLGIGSDSGGSIRLPAAWCGVYGFKPSAGLVPTTGHFPRVGALSDGRTQIGPLARDLALIAQTLPVIAGPDGHDPGVVPVRIPWTEHVDLRGARFAVVVDESEWVTSDELAAAVESAAATMQRAGLERVEWTMPWLVPALDITQRYWNRRDLTGAQAEQQLWDWDRFRRRYLDRSRDVDFLLTPVTRETAPLARDLDGEDFVYTLPASLTGSPAVSVPAGHGAGGLPLAVQLVGRPWEDHRLLAAARIVGVAV